MEWIIEKPGYLYINVSHDAPENVDVYFDDLTVTHTYSPVVAGSDFYPFGLAMEDRQITREKYRYGYQGQFSEKDEETGWNHFELREYDAVIGRMLIPDPYREFWSPYMAMGNDPVNLVDPDGGCSTCFTLGQTVQNLQYNQGFLDRVATGDWTSQFLNAITVTSFDWSDFDVNTVAQDATRFDFDHYYGPVLRAKRGGMVLFSNKGAGSSGSDGISYGGLNLSDIDPTNALGMQLQDWANTTRSLLGHGKFRDYPDNVDKKPFVVDTTETTKWGNVLPGGRVKINKGEMMIHRYHRIKMSDSTINQSRETKWIKAGVNPNN